MMTDEQFAKLPQYARWEIQRLRTDLQSVKSRLREVLGVVDPGPHTPVSYNYADDQQRIPLPNPEVRWPHYGIRIYATEDGLSVFADETLVFTPSSANAGYLFNMQWKDVRDYRRAADFPHR